jgi:dTDP-4-dehydrorhamnose reductase
MNPADSILVVGADGMMGRALAARFAAAGYPVVSTAFLPTPGAIALDLARDAGDWQPPKTAVAYLCGAITSQEQCRTHPAASRAVNVDGTLALAERLARQGTRTVFLSTNLVLAGQHPHQPADEPYAPQTEYGRQKAEAERRLRQLPGTCIVRFTKVLGPAAPLLVRWADSLKRGEVVRPFSDMVMAPVPLGFAVDALMAVGVRRAEGIVQVSAAEDIAYADAARIVASKLGADAELVQPVTVAESGLAIECVPRHTTLDASRLHEEFRLAPPDVQEAIFVGMTP